MEELYCNSEKNVSLTWFYNMLMEGSAYIYILMNTVQFQRNYLFCEFIAKPAENK